MKTKRQLINDGSSTTTPHLHRSNNNRTTLLHGITISQQSFYDLRSYVRVRVIERRIDIIIQRRDIISHLSVISISWLLISLDTTSPFDTTSPSILQVLSDITSPLDTRSYLIFYKPSIKSIKYFLPSQSLKRFRLRSQVFCSTGFIASLQVYQAVIELSSSSPIQQQYTTTIFHPSIPSSPLIATSWYLLKPVPRITNTNIEVASTSIEFTSQAGARISLLLLK